MRRRWTLRAKDDLGTEHTVIVEVPTDSGLIYTAVDGALVLAVRPEDASRLREIYREAMGPAVWDRGHW